MMTMPTPLRFRVAEAFMDSAKDMGDPAMIDVARRVWRNVCYPRTHKISAEDKAIFLNWQNEAWN